MALSSRFSKTAPQDEFVFEPGSADEPPIGAEVKGIGIRWDMMMTLFLRIIAIIWMLKGLRYWSLIIGMGDLPLSEETRLRQGLIVGLALLDCAAAVGLWLLNAWGKSLFLFLATGEIVLALTLKAGIVGAGAAMSAGLMLAIFFALLHAENLRRR